MYRIKTQFADGTNYTAENLRSMIAVCDIALSWAMEGRKIIAIEKELDGEFVPVDICDELHADKFAYSDRLARA